MLSPRASSTLRLPGARTSICGRMGAGHSGLRPLWLNQVVPWLREWEPRQAAHLAFMPLVGLGT